MKIFTNITQWELNLKKRNTQQEYVWNQNTQPEGFTLMKKQGV